jgi:HSP20 family protein
MTIARWQTPESAFEQLFQLSDEVNRLFNAPQGGITRNQPFNTWAPLVDVFEDPDRVTVHIEVAGMRKEDIDVSLHDGALTISGERKLSEAHAKAETYRSERFFGRFQRSVTLPAPVAADKVKASYKDGILTVILPKADEAKPKQIEVSVK